ncbi:CBS domain-containing protein [Paraburkholderia bannensis]|uniref:hypothetical protein n=1 Tax=Paraburkholderia bannensis TaxID=765414 RepID=UPI0012EB3C9E|nr:hypothetical protein [Paraburkholderia bannensis]
MQLINSGTTLTILLSSIPAFAQVTASKISGGLESTAMDRKLTRSGKVAVLNAIDEAMKTLRDDAHGFEGNVAFGKFIDRRNLCESMICEKFIFSNKEIPNSDIEIEKRDDPLDLADDRLNVSAVPYSFDLFFRKSVEGISIDEIKQTIQVEDFWVDTAGKKNRLPADGIQLTPTGTVISYRYRAKETQHSRFPVDVVVTYLRWSRTDPPGTVQRLESIYLSRDYPYLTPEMRKNKREAQQSR